MKLRNVKLVFLREVRDQLRDRRTLFMIVVLPLLLYPSLGIGMLQMMTTFREQARQVVVVGAGNLPASPAFMDSDSINTRWFTGGEADAAKLRIIHDLPVGEDSKLTEEEITEREETISKAMAPLRKLSTEAFEALSGPDAATKDAERQAVADALRDSGADVMVLIPPDFADGLARPLEQSGDAPKYSGPLVMSNSADEKSMLAAQRVLDALRNWEKALLAERLEAAGLPAGLDRPAKIQQIDVAETEQIAANMWSKLFPALLIIMTVTGAFYPAIDLGAGEKERGTMETLLISPAFRSEIVLGKFLTVMLFSCGTAILNLASMGFTGQYMVKMVGQQAQLTGDMSFPPLASLFWLFVLLIPIAALFSALCLGLATFAKSSKEGQYYLTPLLMVTMGLTVFCLSPAVEITPLYSVLPIVNVALLLKGLLLAPVTAQSLYVYILPVLVSSAAYSLLALWWAIELFGSESVLFRAAERVSPKLWLRQVWVNRVNLPSFDHAVGCFAAIMLLQFGFIGAAPKLMAFVSKTLPEFNPNLAALLGQQILILLIPAILLTILLTRSPLQTLRLRLPSPKYVVAAIGLALVLHPLSLELLGSLSWFFPELPPAMMEAIKEMKDTKTPLWVSLCVFAVAPGICEELAFRGFILSGLGRSGRTGFAIVGSAVAFGIMHMIPQQVFNASVLGIVLGLLAVRSRSLFACILFHIAYNSLSVLHGRFGAQVSTEGIFGYLFRIEDGSLRYSPLLLAFAGVIAYRLLCWIGRGGETEDSNQATEGSEKSIQTQVRVTG